VINKQDFFKNYALFDKDILIEIIDIFTQEVPEKIETLKSDLKSNDFRNFRFNAHSLKGTIGSFCAPVVWNMAKELENIVTKLIETDGEGFSENLISEKIKEIEKAVTIMISQLTEIRTELVNK